MSIVEVATNADVYNVSIQTFGKDTYVRLSISSMSIDW